MIGLTLVTVVAVLGAGLNSADAVGDHRPGRRRLRRRLQGRAAYRAAGGDKLAAVPGVKAATQVRSETVLVRATSARSPGSTPPRSRTSTVRLDDGLRSDARAARSDGAIVTKAYAEDNHLAVGGKLAVTTPAGQQGRARRPRDLRPARSRAAARRHQHRPADVRRRSRAQEQPDVPRRGRRCGRGDQVHGRRPRRRARPHRSRLRRRPRPRTGRRRWPCSTCCSASRSS